MKIGYLVDSTFVIPKKNENDEIVSRLEWLSLLVVDPLLNQYEEERVTITEEKLLELFKKFPNQGLTTSTTPIGKIDWALKDMLKEYDYVIGIPLAKVLSSQYNLWKSMETKEGFKGKFFVYGDRNCFAESFKEIKIIDSVLKNHSTLNHDVLNQCAIEVKKRRDFRIVFFVTDLTRLYLSGRITKTQLKLGKFAKLKVSLEFKKTGVELLEKGRSMFKLIDSAIDYVKKDLKTQIPNGRFSAHLYFFAMEDEIKNKVIKVTKDKIEISETSSVPPIIATHLGTNHVIIIVSCEKNDAS